jgi:hypothetical protein
MRSTVCLSLTFLFTACSPPLRPTPDAARTDASARGDAPLPEPGVVCTPASRGVVCAGAFAVTCEGELETARENCGGSGEICFDGFGCGACRPGTARCDGDASSACLPDGSGYGPETTCDAAAGETCRPSLGGCVSPCAASAAERSYVGCEYFPTPVVNSSLRRDHFPFAVAVANAGSAAAQVIVTRLGTVVGMASVPAGGLATLELPWIDELQGAGDASTLVRQGSYLLASSRPVTVYQFNPLTYEYGGGGFAEYSYTNDASLLLPSHVMTGNYVVVSRPTHAVETVLHHPTGDVTQSFQHSGFVAITAVQGAAVDVEFTAYTLASMDASSGVRAFRPGDTGHFELLRGDVLQLLSAAPATCDRAGGMETRTFDGGVTQDSFYCAVGREYDLTGTRVRASAPVQVVSGHDCAFVPYDRWACDHLEEQLFPVETWGREAIVSITEPLRGEPNLVRIVSGRDGNALTFDPEGVHEPVVLDLGEFLELPASGHFRVTGTGPLVVAQFMVGQDFAGIATSGDMANGDPSYSLAIPTEQFRTDYTFLAPDTYVSNRVNVTAPVGAVVELDGVVLDPANFVTVGSTGMAVARIAVEGGAHRIEGPEPFGIVLYGLGRYTSYMVPGGLDLEPISAPF